jgi:alpha-1,2-mannosyltransferase
MFGGIALWGRLHAALIVGALGLGVAIVRRRSAPAVRAGLVSAAGLVLATLWTHWMYGTWSPAGGYDAGGYVNAVAGGAGVEARAGSVVNHLGLWVSPDRGLLIWTPVLLLLAPTVARSWTSLTDWSRWLLVGGVAYTLVQGQLNVFTGGDGFYGYRLTLEMLGCAAPAYALASPHMGRVAASLVGPLIGLQFGAILLGAESEAWFVVRQDAWTDNSLWLALRHEPAVGVWLLLTVGLGALAGRVWRQHAAPPAKNVGVAA